MVPGQSKGGRYSLLAAGQALLQRLHKREDPVVAQDYTLGQAQVEGFHGHQPWHMHLRMAQQCIQQIQKCLSGLICREQWTGRPLLATVSWVKESQKAERNSSHSGLK